MTQEQDLSAVPVPPVSGGTGTVFISRFGDGTVTGYWDSLPDAPPALLEDMPPGLNLLLAVEWGFERTPVVALRVDSTGYRIVVEVGDVGTAVPVPLPPFATGPVSMEEVEQLNHD